MPQVGGFELQLQRLSAELDKYLEQPVPEEIREQVMEFYFSVWNFLGICDRLDDNYVIYTDFSEEGHFWLHLYCVRPAEKSAPVSGLRYGNHLFLSNPSAGQLL